MSTPAYPADRYCCLLDEQPHYLVPSRLLQQSVPSGACVINPDSWFSWQGPFPPDKAARVPAITGFCSTERVVWVDDPATRCMWPFWVGPEYFALLSNLSPGRMVGEEVPAHARWALYQANVLVEPGQSSHRRKAWLDLVWCCAPQFQRGFVSVANLIHPFHIGALRRYYRYHTRVGALVLGDTQVRRRYAAHDESVASFFHLQLANAVSDIARTIVKPSYSYFVSYQGGSELARHTEREQCEYSLAISLDASPEPAGQSPWPVQLETCDGVLKIWQYFGDGLLYRGRVIPQSRDRLPDGCSSTSILFHYVDESFAESLA